MQCVYACRLVAKGNRIVVRGEDVSHNSYTVMRGVLASHAYSIAFSDPAVFEDCYYRKSRIIESDKLSNNLASLF